MSKSPGLRGLFTEEAGPFEPDLLLSKWSKNELSAPAKSSDFRLAITKAFNLHPSDQFEYHAMTTVTLPQAQQVVDFGAKGELHAWYRDGKGKELPPPTPTDITAYTHIFNSTTSTARALTAFHSNAKKDSHRLHVAVHLLSFRLFPSTLIIPKLKTPHTNPYLDFWAWSCKTLEWTGPTSHSHLIQQSHHILPIFYHHFGCVCPSFEALYAIVSLAGTRPILDLGSGNGYWTYMLRCLSPLPQFCNKKAPIVHAVDNGDSIWRTTWIPDTVVADGPTYLSKTFNGAPDMVLLLVYPQVTTKFTTSVLKAYKGNTIVVAGTQNANGFTAFREETVDVWVEREMGGDGWRKTVQIALPSFAGKDEALFVFEKTEKERHI